MIQLVLIAARNLAKHRKRTVLFGGAIAAVTTMLVFLLCLSSGVRTTVQYSASTLFSGHLYIGGFYKATPSRSAAIVTDYRAIENIAKRALPDLESIEPRGRGIARATSATGSATVFLNGIQVEKEANFATEIRLLSGKVETLKEPNTALIFEELAKKLAVRVGDPLTLSSTTVGGQKNTVDLRVAAIAQSAGRLGASKIFMPEPSFRELANVNSETTGLLLVTLRDSSRAPRDQEILRTALASARYTLMDSDPVPYQQKLEEVNHEDWTGQRLDIVRWDEEFRPLLQSLSSLDSLTYLLTIALVIIILVGMMNTMWITIRERTREIGTLRAIGMRRESVLVIFLLEAFFLSAGGAVLGTVCAVAIAELMNRAHIAVPSGAEYMLMSKTLHLAVDPARICLGVVAVVAFTTLISIIPSTYAARLRPIKAMQHIG